MCPAGLFGTKPKNAPVTRSRLPYREHVTEPKPLEWRVLIEETEGLSRENQRMTITRGWRCATHDEAMRNALEVARTHQPEHPLSPRGRAVYQVGEDTWLVRVFGMTRNYHFRVIVARLTSGSDV